MDHEISPHRIVRTFLAVVGHIASLGVAIYSVVLAVGTFFAYGSCFPESSKYGCGTAVHLINVVIAPMGNFIGVVIGAGLTWVFATRPRLRWLCAGLALQVASISVAWELLPLEGYDVL